MPSASVAANFNSANANHSSHPPMTPKRVLSAIHNIPRRMKSAGQLRAASARGKENAPPQRKATRLVRPRPPPITLPPLPALPIHCMGDADSYPSPIPWSASRLAFSARLQTTAEKERDGADKWAAKDGQIVIKVWVPSTDDIWKIRVPEDVALAAFRSRVAAKIGFDISFAAVTGGRLRTIAEDGTFRSWVRQRVRKGRNQLLTAHRLVLQ